MKVTNSKTCLCTLKFLKHSVDFQADQENSTGPCTELDSFFLTDAFPEGYQHNGTCVAEMRKH